MKDWRAAACGWIGRQGRQVFDAPVANGRNGSVKQDRTGEEVISDLMKSVRSERTRIDTIVDVVRQAQEQAQERRNGR